MHTRCFYYFSELKSFSTCYNFFIIRIQRYATNNPKFFSTALSLEMKHDFIITLQNKKDLASNETTEVHTSFFYTQKTISAVSLKLGRNFANRTFIK